MNILIAVVVLGLVLTIIAAVGDHDSVPTAIMGILATGLAALVVGVVLEIFYGRQAFAATTACEARRLEARRQAFSANVVCVPAYRATKNDTTTVNLNTQP